MCVLVYQSRNTVTLVATAMTCLYRRVDAAAAISPNFTWLVTSRLDTLDVSSESRQACQAMLFDKLDTSNVSRRVET